MTTVVVGAGIIGITLAYQLQKRGRNVVVIERDAPGKGTSFGNMASIAVTEFMPASRPAIWKQVPGWMLDPEGPMRVRPSYMPRLVPWLMSFIAASRPAKLCALEEQGAALGARVQEDFAALLQETGLTGELSEAGCLALYANEAELKADQDYVDLLERYKLPHELIGRQAIKALEPEISDKIELAILLPQNHFMRNPYQLVVKLAEAFKGLGGKIEQGEVVGFTRGGAMREVHLKDGRKIAAEEVAICAGIQSAALCKLLGEPVPLETERGYHTQIMSPGISLKHSLRWPARAFMVTPTAGGIRVGGTVEFAGLDAPPDFRRSKITVKHATEALPNLRCENFTEWMGHRPALPDTIPVISASAKTKGLFYALGHGHLGLTYSATTARLLADLITGAKPPINLHSYRIDRF